MNSLLGNSRATIKEAKAILQRTATRMLDIQRDEAYASAVLIQLVKSLRVGPIMAPSLPMILLAAPDLRRGYLFLSGI